MKSRDIPFAIAASGAEGPPAQTSIPQLVGEIYESVPPSERASLLEPLLRPLGVLSLLGIANGIFASVRFRSGWPDMHVQLEDIRNVRGSDVTALFDYAQQVSVEAVDGLVQMVSASPVLAGSAAAWLLATALVRLAEARRTVAHGPRKSSVAPS